MLQAQSPESLSRPYPVICECLEHGRRPCWRDERGLVLRMRREAMTDGSAWSTADIRRLIRMARVAAKGAAG